MEVLHAAHVGLALARISAEQEELRRAEIIVRAQIGVAGGDRPAGPLRSHGDRFVARAGRLPGVIPALAVADLDLLQHAVGFVEVGAPELRDVHDAGGEVIGPALVAGKVTEHGHALRHFLDTYCLGR